MTWNIKRGSLLIWRRGSHIHSLPTGPLAAGGQPCYFFLCLLTTRGLRIHTSRDIVVAYVGQILWTMALTWKQKKKKDYIYDELIVRNFPCTTSSTHSLWQCVPSEAYGDQRIGINHRESSTKDLTTKKSGLNKIQPTNSYSRYV